MIFDIFPVISDKLIRFSAFDRGMMAASKDIKSVSGCYVLRSKWRPKLEKYDENRPFSNKRALFLFSIGLIEETQSLNFALILVVTDILDG